MALFRPRRHGEHRGGFDSATEARRTQRWLCFGHGGHGVHRRGLVRPRGHREHRVGSPSPNGRTPGRTRVAAFDCPCLSASGAGCATAYIQQLTGRSSNCTISPGFSARSRRSSLQLLCKLFPSASVATMTGRHAVVDRPGLPRASSAPWSAGSPLPGVGTVVAAVEPSSAVRARLKTPGNSRAVIGKMPGRSAGEHRANGRVHATEIAHQLALPRPPGLRGHPRRAPCPPCLRGRNKPPLGVRCASVATQDGSVSSVPPWPRQDPPRCALCLRGHPRRAPCPPCLRGHLRVSGAPRTRAD